MSDELKATITQCPGCGASLGLPGNLQPLVELECPECAAHFALATVDVRELRTARIAAPMAPSVTEQSEPSFDGIPELRDATLQFEALETPFAAHEQPIEVDFDLSAPGPFKARADSASVPLPSEASPKWLPLSETVTFDSHAAKELPIQAPIERSVVDNPPVDDLPSFAPPIADNHEPITSDDVDPGAATVAISPESTVRFDDEFPAETFANAPVEHGAPSQEFDGGLYDFPDAEEAAENFEEAPALGLDDFTPEAPEHDQHSGFDDQQQFDLRPAPRSRRRRSSPVRSLVGIVGGGFIGLFLAGYALLWMKGANADFFQMANWLPQAILPPSMRSASNDFPPNRAGQAGAHQGGLLANAGTESPTNPPSGDATTSADPTATDAPAGDQVTAQSPLQVDPAVTPASATDVSQTPTSRAPTSPAAPAKANWPSTPIVGDLIEPKLFSLDELSEAARAAEGAGRRFVSGDLAKPESVRDMGQAYILLCAAAERLTLTDPAAYGNAMFTQQALAKKPINLAAGNVARRHDLAVIAARWLQHDRRQNQGAVFVGKVLDMKAQGAWTEYQIEIAYGDQKTVVPVLLDKLRFTSGAEAAIAGVIVADPQKHIAGYQGDALQIVVAGYAFDPSRYADADASEPAPEFEFPEK